MDLVAANHTDCRGLTTLPGPSCFSETVYRAQACRRANAPMTPSARANSQSMRAIAAAAPSRTTGSRPTGTVAATAAGHSGSGGMGSRDLLLTVGRPAATARVTRRRGALVRTREHALSV